MLRSTSSRLSPAIAVCLWLLIAAAPAEADGAPRITSIAPNNGPVAGGTEVEVHGEGFERGAIVTFGATAAAASVVDSASLLEARSPAGSGLARITVETGLGSSPAVPAAQFGYDQPPSVRWLGLNGNGSSKLGPIDKFAQQGIVYDRSGPIDWIAGRLPAERGRTTSAGAALSRDYEAGLTPVVTIEYRDYTGAYEPDPHFPTERSGSHSLSEYVSGFVSSANAILAAHPGRAVLFEPMNEPWGYTTPQYEGAQYAAVIAKLLPAAARAGIPLADIYVAATGRHWVQKMYEAEPALQSEIDGWYLHPYGPPTGSLRESSEGIQSLPQVQAEMTSGQNNLIVSEVGFCARDVNDGLGCGGPATDTDEQAGELLAQTLEDAAPFHRAGWLRALLVYSRSAGGWAMQFPDGSLTAQGRALLAFVANLPPTAVLHGFGGLGLRLPSFFSS